MNIAIYTHDLTKHNTRLMPWRVIAEMATHMEDLGHRVIVLNGTRASNCTSEDRALATSVRVPKLTNLQGVEAVAQVCKSRATEILFYPLGWRAPIETIREIESRANLTIVWYIPSAWYHLPNVLKVLPHMGIRATLPYLYQASVPRRRFAKRLRCEGDRSVITMTDFNNRMLIESGYPGEYVTCVPPGRSESASEQAVGTICDRITAELRNRPYFLFFGPPQAIRGVHILLQAFNYLCRKHDEACLVCLFRSDVGVQIEALRKKVEGSQYHGKRLFCVWESMAEAELNTLVGRCHAVVKPFLIVPSEVPLAVIEAAGHGKPVICSDPDGTGHYVEAFGLNVPPADSRSLGQAMLRLLVDNDLYKAKCRAALSTYAQHPTWQETAKMWTSVAQAAIKKDQSRRMERPLSRCDS